MFNFPNHQQRHRLKLEIYLSFQTAFINQLFSFCLLYFHRSMQRYLLNANDSKCESRWQLLMLHNSIICFNDEAIQGQQYGSILREHQSSLLSTNYVNMLEQGLELEKWACIFINRPCCGSLMSITSFLIIIEPTRWISYISLLSVQSSLIKDFIHLPQKKESLICDSIDEKKQFHEIFFDAWLF